MRRTAATANRQLSNMCHDEYLAAISAPRYPELHIRTRITEALNM
jgi:hypothetical protein